MSEDQFTKLFKYMQQESKRIDERFEKRDDEFARLFRYMEGRFQKIDNRFEKVDRKFDDVMNAVDALAKQVEVYTHEMLALSHQVGRHDKWIRKIAKTTDVKLSA